MRRQIIALSLPFLSLGLLASDFDDVLDTVVKNNLGLKYGLADKEASIAEMKSENTLEAPEVGFESLWGMKGIGDKRNFSISQSFDWPGVYAARSEAVRKSETAMQYLRESAVIDTRMEVRLLLVDIIYARQRLATTKKICDSLSEMVKYFKEAVACGSETRLDYNKPVVEHINANRELKTLQGELSTLKASLQALNGGEDVSALVEQLGMNYPHPDLESLRPDVETLRQNDPAQAAARASLEAQKSLVKVEKRSLLPGFSLAYLHEWEMGDRFNGFSLSLTLPFLTQRKKAKAAIMRAEAMAFEQDMELVKLAAGLQGEYDTACELRDLLRKYKDVMSDDSTYELLKKALDAGQINFLTYMQELNFFLTARRDFLDAHYRYHVAVARLQRYQ